MDDRYLQGRDTPSGVRDVRRKARGPRPRARSACDDRHLDERCERRRPRFVGKDSGSDPRIATMMRGERKGVTLRSAYFATLTAKERGHSSLSTHGLRTPKLCRVSALNSADTAWMLISTALVLVMTPAVGFFYSGMVRRKNTLNTLMMSFASLGFVGLAWARDGWLAKLGTLDFAGGTVVHINAAAAAFVVALVVGPRKDFARQALLPQNIPFTLLGAGLAWFGWFGFNAGSALGANASAALALVNTMFAPMATSVVWAILDMRRTGKVTAIGLATAIVGGLLAITPAAGFVRPVSAIVIGAASAFPSYFALLFRARTRLDDSLDVVSAHGVGGIMGALLTGVLAQKAWNGATDGALFGNPGQLWTQAIAVVATIVYSMVATYVILKVMGLVVTLRASTEQEGVGLDVGQHGEEAYSHGEGAILIVGERRGKGR